LSTNSLVKKVFCVLCLITLASACVYFADQNIRGYKEYNIVTQIKIIENQTITFPAVTMCLQDIRKIETVSNAFNITIFNDIFPLNLEDVLTECFFENPINKCSVNDFENFQVYNQFLDRSLNCYQFNGGHIASNQKTDIMT